MDSTKVLLTKLEAWAEEAASAEGVTAYPQEPPNYSDAFPLVAGAIQRDEEQESSRNFSEQGYEQLHIQFVTVDLHVLTAPDPAWTADQLLYDIVDSLKAALRRDQSLNKRVEMASRLYEVTYDGEVQTADGTVARMATFRITVGQRVEA